MQLCGLRAKSTKTENMIYRNEPEKPGFRLNQINELQENS